MGNSRSGRELLRTEEKLMTALMIVFFGALLIGAVLIGIWVTGRKKQEIVGSGTTTTSGPRSTRTGGR